MQEEFEPRLETSGQEMEQEGGTSAMGAQEAGAQEEPVPSEAPQSTSEEAGDAQQLVSPQALARANELLTQARVIERLRGVDVLSLFRTDAEGRQRVLSGEWDMTDLLSAAQPPAGRAPSPVRSANGAVGAVDVRGMSDAQFASLNRMLAGGQIVDVRG